MSHQCSERMADLVGKGLHELTLRDPPLIFDR